MQTTELLIIGATVFLSLIMIILYVGLRLQAEKENRALDKKFYKIGKKIDKRYYKLKEKLITDRELQVLHLLYQGTKRSEIAEQLFISEGTVKNHIKKVYSKLGVNSITEFLKTVEFLLKEETDDKVNV